MGWNSGMISKDEPFDLETFLSSVDGGRTISKYRKDEAVFAQGDPANAVFYIRKGECKVTVVSESQSMGRGTFLAKAA
jgi:CRP/FNR family transcriptional regulator, cyclic AMP receptor protein